MSSELDFHLDGSEPADAASEHAEQQAWAGDLTVLAEHHTTPNGSHSFVVAHDGAVTWGVPGDPQIRAIKVVRDLNENTFTFESTYHSTVPFAQNWLVERGCPPERITQTGGGSMEPADDLTAQIEQQLRTSGARYEVLDSYTSDCDPCETWTLTRDSQAAQEPIRLFLEEANHASHSYTVREGAFTEEGAARQWLDDREGLLPLPPGYRGQATALRTRAALARSADASAATKAGRRTHGVSAASTLQQRNPRRSI